jgi:SPP1 gp7 family putative phage head morphogenesis protein
MLGQDPQKAIDAISRKMGTSKANAGRLVMTEEAFFSSAAQKDCFHELDVEQYRILATLDSHTSDICREMDGKVFPMKDFEPGVTAPPFHVWCRTTTVPHFGDEFDFIGKRAARGEDGKTYYVPSSMTYQEWEKAMVNGDKSGLREVSDSSTIKTEAENRLESAVCELPIISDIKTDDDRRAFAERLIDGLGIDHTNIPIAVEKTGGARGACSFYPQKDHGVCDYVRYSLEKGDDRLLEYQIKTAFHEAYHLSCQGKEWDAVLNGRINPKWVSIEETFAEASAHYAAQIYGINNISPAYADTLIQTLPRLRHIEKYSGCTTLTDFGEIAWKERLSGGGGRWAALYEKVFAITLDESEYYGQYFEYVRKNMDSLIDKTLENSPKFRQYKDLMKEDLESAMQKIESGVPVSELNQNEGFIFPQVLINAMAREGVK